MITLTDIFEVSAALEDGSLDVHLRALFGFRAWHMVVEHEAELGTDALLFVVQAGDKADNINGALGFAITGPDDPAPAAGAVVQGSTSMKTAMTWKVEVLVVGAVGDKEAVRLSRALKKCMIERHKPTEQGSYRAQSAHKLKPSINVRTLPTQSKQMQDNETLSTLGIKKLRT